VCITFVLLTIRPSLPMVGVEGRRVRSASPPVIDTSSGTLVLRSLSCFSFFDQPAFLSAICGYCPISRLLNR
jgi:hypothetical protein